MFDLGLIAGHTAHPYRLQCEQFRLCSALMGELRDNRLFRMRRGSRVTACSQDTEFVDVAFEVAGAPAHERCRWLIAADGAGSTVRKSLGLAFAGSVFARTSITLVLDYPFEQHVPGLLGVNYVWTDSGHYSLMKVRDSWRFSYSPEPGQTVEQALQPAAVQARLQAVFPFAHALLRGAVQSLHLAAALSGRIPYWPRVVLQVMPRTSTARPVAWA